ncbi:putative ABC transporter ATP-binding protein YknV [Paenibacillus baekrokdamisoli]|uniref:Putative ABC transporter ATP-binding protein YknV n=1 Tax=Paenibacillus baekrokdamisoli TaxID=1712516 RepID=A0A3G9IV35_9BACL|nr:ABC transporter ATP-binding protein [Paenibacillus baekrokdamisoli]MBB3070594.1 ATP-binding cassette subfamily B protein [Paenibacillus baekrokdamisoli]BBH19945.1 putative ABC transporter ATP-binding protein YknV [Paenibacillus baekrokdamisoli]
MSQVEWDSDELEEKPFNRTYMKRLFKYVLPYRRVLTIVIIIVLFNMALSLAEPLLLRVIIDKGIGLGNPNFKIIHWIGFSLLAIRIIGWVFGYWHTKLINFTGQRILFDLRQQLFNHLQTLSFRFFDGRPAGKIMSRITNDTNAIGELINGGLITIVMEVTHLVGIVAILLWMDWKLALLSFITMPLLYLIVGKMQPKIESSWSRSRKTMSAINGNVNETIQGIRVIQAFSRQKANNRRFETLNSNNKSAFMRAVTLESTVWPAVEMIGMIGTCIVLWFGAKLVMDQVLTLGFIMAFINYLWRFWGPLSALSKVYSQVLSAMASAERIFEVLDTDPEVKDQTDAKPLKTIQGSVVFENVSFRYGEDKPEVLHGVNLQIKPGQRVALVGPTGAGKSTIVNLLMRFYDATGGRILIDGQDVKDVTLESLRRQMGIVLQDSFIFSGTIEENLRYGNEDASDEALMRAATSVRIDKFVSAFADGYHTQVEERGSKLSVGQRQLLAFGRVLLSDPRILILDEATSSVDTETEQHIQSALQTVLEGRTAFIIAHRLSTIRDADLILVVQDGRISEQGTHDELLKIDGLYRKLYRTQFEMQQSLTMQTGA